jgi:hypothetical protein
MSKFSGCLRALAVAVATMIAAPLTHAAPVLSVPTTLAFGNVLIGTSKTLALTATNTSGAGSGANNCANTFRLCVTFSGAVDGTGDEFTPNTSLGPLGPLGAFSSVNPKFRSRDYTYTPTARHTDTATVTVTTNNPTRDGIKTTTLSGKGVAPVNDVESSDAGATRVGTTGEATVTVTNVGDGNLSGLGDVSNLKGTVGAPVGDAAFTGPSPDDAVNLGDGLDKVFHFAFAPTARGLFSTDVTTSFTNGSDDGTNATQDVVSELNGLGVGPVYDSVVAPGGLIDFGLIEPGTTSTLDLVIANITSDLGFDIALNGLTLLDAVFSGPDAGLFTIDGGFAPIVLDPDGTFSTTLTIRYAPPGDPNATYDAILTILTDQGAAFGEAGESFSYDLAGGTTDANGGGGGGPPRVPEPAGLGLLLAALMAMGASRKSRASV